VKTCCLETSAMRSREARRLFITFEVVIDNSEAKTRMSRQQSPRAGSIDRINKDLNETQSSERNQFGSHSAHKRLASPAEGS